LDAATAGDLGFFRGCLPSREMWRLCADFSDQALFLDIDTTGLDSDHHDITVIGALGRGKLALFIKGINLDQFPAYVAQFPLLVSFNGSQFDVPFLLTHFPEARLDQAHIDLRFVLRSLGYHGGLKAIERNPGIARDAAIQGVDGFEAVHLCHRCRRGDRVALVKLALYNLTDVVNMVELVEIAMRLKHERLALPGEMLATQPQTGFKYEPEYLGFWIVQQLGRGEYGWSSNLTVSSTSAWPMISSSMAATGC
jgi:uncharacterized protein YprB with RNaseH-like and TPR domain